MILIIFITKDRASYNRHNTEFIAQQVALQRLIAEAEKLGCIVPPEAYYWASISPPNKHALNYVR